MPVLLPCIRIERSYGHGIFHRGAPLVSAAPGQVFRAHAPDLQHGGPTELLARHVETCSGRLASPERTVADCYDGVLKRDLPKSMCGVVTYVYPSCDQL